jgi:hypothetical protein
MLCGVRWSSKYIERTRHDKEGRKERRKEERKIDRKDVE